MKKLMMFLTVITVSLCFSTLKAQNTQLPSKKIEKKVIAPANKEIKKEKLPADKTVPTVEQKTSTEKKEVKQGEPKKKAFVKPVNAQPKKAESIRKS